MNKIFLNETYKVVVNLVCNNWHIIAFGHLQNSIQVGAGVDGTARVGRIIKNNRCRLVVNLRLQMFQIHFPTAFRLIKKSMSNKMQ